jgi:hypothetical protein
MIRSKHILMGWLFCSCSCNNAFNKGGVLNETEMVYLLNEVALAEGFAESYLFRDTLRSKDSILKTELDKVLAVNHVTAEQFSRSYQYYKKKPEVFKVLIDSANALASRNRELIYSKRKVNQQ